MAEVYLALQQGIGGFEKLVVVKRILSRYCANPVFVQMFLDEARLAASLRHPAIVEIFDIGEDFHGYFTVMEYLSGETVVHLAQSLSRRALTMPPAIVCRIGATLAAGLHHAHTAMDPAGEPRAVVHRDVTPSNLMVCYSGAVKLVDFGVAQAMTATGSHPGRAGQKGELRGKVSYMAPEMIRDGRVDGRADVFQLGVVLHELLLGRRLFHGHTNQDRAMAVLNREIPRPGALCPDVPAQVDAILLSALERDPDKRIRSAGELCNRLEEALKAMGRTVSNHELGSWMRRTFAGAYARRLGMERLAVTEARTSREHIHTRASLVPMPPQAGPDPMSHETKNVHDDRATVVEPVWSVDEVTATAPGSPGPQEIVQAQPGSRPAPARRGLWPRASVLASLFVIILLGAGIYPQQAPEAAGARASKTFSASVTAVPLSASIELDGMPAATGRFSQNLPEGDSGHVLVIKAPGYRPQTLRFSAGRPLPPVVILERLPAGQAAGSHGRAHDHDLGRPISAMDRGGR